MQLRVHFNRRKKLCTPYTAIAGQRVTSKIFPADIKYAVRIVLTFCQRKRKLFDRRVKYEVNVFVDDYVRAKRNIVICSETDSTNE